MADYRQIHVKTWRRDEWFLDLPPLDKLLFIYLFSNEAASVSGLYEALPLKTMAFETGIEPEYIEQALARFEKAGKVYCEDGWIWIVNLRRYNATRSPKVTTRIQKDLELVPEGEFKTRYIEYYRGIDTLSIPEPENPKTVTEQEQEQEPEQEHIEQELEQEITPSADAGAPPPPSSKPKKQKPEPKSKSPPLTAGQRGFLDLFGAKRYKTIAQREAVEKMEQEHGAEKLLAVARWAAERGMSVGQAVGSVRTALPKWGKDKRGGRNTSKTRVDLDNPLRLKLISEGRMSADGKFVHPDEFARRQQEGG